MAGIALVATNVGWLGERHRHAETRAAYSDLKESNVEAQRLALVNLRARETAHSDAVQAITKRSASEKNRIAADLRSQLDSLRNRPDRSPDAVPGGAADPVGCTGAGLARQDAEFLAGYAAAAAELANALGECRAAYDAAVRLTAPVLH
jgi:hypothetical protein